jgi:molecular chaperone GrpE
MFTNRNRAHDKPGGGAPGDSTPGDPAHTDRVAELEAELEKVAAERDEAKSAYLRALADFQNFQRRSIENEREAKRQGVTSLLLSVVPVIDHFDLALSHKPENMSAQQVVDGVRVIREELLRVLGQHGVSVVSPAPNDELDPNRHHAVLHQPAEGVLPGHISRTLQVGYMLGDRVIRPANVAVAPDA